jgi:hypothetical protein
MASQRAEEALYILSGSNEIKSGTRRVLNIKILYVCSEIVKINKKSGSMPPNP